MIQYVFILPRLQGHPLVIDYVSQFLSERAQILANSHQGSVVPRNKETSTTQVLRIEQRLRLD